jgi:hypothetical protein
MGRPRGRLTYANVMATIAVFIALGGSTYAATQVQRNSVGNRQLKKNAVTTEKVKDGAIIEADLEPGLIPDVSGLASRRDLAGYAYSKGESDGRYLRGTIVVVKTIADKIAKGSYATGQVECPPGYQAIGGGVDPNGVQHGKVSASAPLVDGVPPIFAADGIHGPSNGWFGAVTAQGGEADIQRVAIQVICSPLG